MCIRDSANPNYFLFAGAPDCSSPCISFDTGFAWNHGDVNPDINTTWLGMVGPGVRHLGVDSTLWTDHTDIRPTIMLLLGLKDDYDSDGRALFEVLENWAVPQSLLDHRATLSALANVYKQINACVGELGLATLRISTKALESNSSGDSTYNNLETMLSNITTVRNNLASQMSDILEDATFDNQSINVSQANQLIQQANNLLNQAEAAAA